MSVYLTKGSAVAHLGLTHEAQLNARLLRHEIRPDAWLVTRSGGQRELYSPETIKLLIELEAARNETQKVS